MKLQAVGRVNTSQFSNKSSVLAVKRGFNLNPEASNSSEAKSKTKFQIVETDPSASALKSKQQTQTFSEQSASHLNAASYLLPPPPQPPNLPNSSAGSQLAKKSQPTSSLSNPQPYIEGMERDEESREKAMLAVRKGINKMEKRLNDYNDLEELIDQEAQEHKTKGGSKQVLEELDQWKNQVEHSKRRLLNPKQATVLGSSSSTPNLQALRIMSQSNLSEASERKRLLRQGTLTLQIKEITSEINEEGDMEMDRKKKTKVIHKETKESVLEIEPQIDELMLNHIMTPGGDEDFEDQSQGQVGDLKRNENYFKMNNLKTQNQLTEEHRSSTSSSMIGSSRMLNLVKTQSQPSLSVSPIKAFQKTVKFKEDVAQQAYTERDIHENNNSSRTHNLSNDSQQQQSQQPQKPLKKVLKQLQYEANSKLIEKLFLMKLRKRMNPQSVDSKTSSEPTLKQHLNKGDGTDIIQDVPPLNEATKREQRMAFVEKQQTVVKEEIENFQKKTLESFKFIQELRRTRIATPKLLGLINGKKVGVMDSEWKADLYTQQLEQEYALKSFEKAQRLENELKELGKHPDKLEEVHAKLFEKYALALELSRNKKNEIEELRLRNCQQNNLLQQRLEEHEMNNKRFAQFSELSQSQPSLSELSPRSPAKSPSRNMRRSQSRSPLKLHGSRIPSETDFDSLKAKAEAHRQMLINQYEQSKEEFHSKGKWLKREIAELKMEIAASAQGLDVMYYDLQDFKQAKSIAKKALHDYYLSLFNFDKSADSLPLISITKLITFMQGIGEEINEKMLPDYFDKESIVFVKKLQGLYHQIDKIDDDLGTAQREIKQKIHSQMHTPLEAASPSVFSRQGNKYKYKPSLIDFCLKMHGSQRMGDEDYQKLMQLMLGNEVDHKREIKAKLKVLSQKTIMSPRKEIAANFTGAQQQQQLLQLQQLHSPRTSENISSINNINAENNTTKGNLNFTRTCSINNQVATPNNNSNQTVANMYWAGKRNNSNSLSNSKSDERYLLLYPLKKGSLSALTDQKEILEKLKSLQREVLALKQTELERQVKLYYNVTADDRINNVHKLFIFIYGPTEGNYWFSQFVIRRKEIHQKSLTNKTFSFAQILFSNKQNNNTSSSNAANNAIENNELHNLAGSAAAAAAASGDSKDNNNLLDQIGGNTQIAAQSALQTDRSNVSLDQKKAQIRRNFDRLQTTASMHDFSAVSNANINNNNRIPSSSQPSQDSFQLFMQTKSTFPAHQRNNSSIPQSKDQIMTLATPRSSHHEETNYSNNTLFTPNSKGRSVHFPNQQQSKQSQQQPQSFTNRIEAQNSYLFTKTAAERNFFAPQKQQNNQQQQLFLSQNHGYQFAQL